MYLLLIQVIQHYNLQGLTALRIDQYCFANIYPSAKRRGHTIRKRVALKELMENAN